jgi:hypothetical protein
MPEFTVKEVRLPELHLPEIKREEIVRTLTGVRLPEVDLAKARRATVRIPTVKLSSEDIGKLIAGAAAVARFARPTPRGPRFPKLRLRRGSKSPITRIVRPRRSRSRWPLAFGGIIVASLAGFALLRRPGVRERVDGVARRARERLAEFRAGPEGWLDVDADEPVAFTAASTAPIDDGGFASGPEDVAESGTTDYPEGLGSGSNDGDGIPAFEESSRAT